MIIKRLYSWYAPYISYLYLSGLCLMAVGLPLSRFVMSVASFFLIGTWLIEGDYRRKLVCFWNNKAAWALCFIFLLHLAGLIHGGNLDYAVNDLRIKIPLLVLPIVFAGMPKLSTAAFKAVLIFFVLAVFLGTLASYGALAGFFEKKINDIRGISIFISNVRFGVMVCIAIFIAGYFVFQSKDKSSWLWAAITLWLLVFLIVLQSITGLVILGAGFTFFLFYKSFQTNVLYKRMFMIGIPALALLATSTYVFFCFHAYQKINPAQELPLEVYSSNGEKYEHKVDHWQRENGNYVWRYIAWGELARSWNKRSKIDFYDKDKKGSPIFGTLIRYMTSKGLRKDSEGVDLLSQQDIVAIENGETNFLLSERSGLHNRLNAIFFEFENYTNGGNPSGHSVAQRLEFWQIANLIIRDNFWFGVGTGNVQAAFDLAYAETNSQLHLKYQHRAHNQYLTVFVAFGVVGLLTFMVALFFPLLKEKMYKDYFYLLFFVSFFMSFLTEDTLETQAGLTYFTFFSCLFLFAREDSMKHLTIDL